MEPGDPFTCNCASLFMPGGPTDWPRRPVKRSDEQSGEMRDHQTVFNSPWGPSKESHPSRWMKWSLRCHHNGMMDHQVKLVDSGGFLNRDAKAHTSFRYITLDRLNAFRESIAKTGWNNVYGASDPDEAYNIFLINMQCLYRTHFATRSIKLGVKTVSYG